MLPINADPNEQPGYQCLQENDLNDVFPEQSLNCIESAFGSWTSPSVQCKTHSILDSAHSDDESDKAGLGLLGEGWSFLAPATSKDSYAIVGTGAMLASASQGPLSSVVFMLELTNHTDA
jgi:hypothetical protein